MTESVFIKYDKPEELPYPLCAIVNKNLYYDKNRELIFTGYVTKDFLEKYGIEVVLMKGENQ